jgi:hypothetical protein
MTITPAAVGSPLLNEREAAVYVRVALSTFKRSVRPHLPQVRPSPGRVLFRKVDIDRFLETRMQDDH